MNPFRVCVVLSLAGCCQLIAQPLGEPDQAAPGDQMIQDYLRQETAKIETDLLDGIKSAEDWNRVQPQWRSEYLEMLGLWPWPEKTPLRATVTRTLDRGDYTVEMVHYQSRPGLYVTGNLYRPAHTAGGERLPAVFYVCGHSGRGRDGNKTAFQSHGIWLARHGYVCLIVDTLQLGEIAGVHHGTYREGRWWWLSRGYTPAGVECWNGVRGIDYLLSRPDVDPERIGVTGISGGGAATFWIAAADERVKVAVPVSGMADLASYVPNRVVNGHCDCMFLYNAFQWPWTRIAALVAPRPLLFANSDQDNIFPMDANERVINRLERVYSLFGASDMVDSFVSIGGHAYRQDIRQAAMRFLNTYLKQDPRLVRDSEIDLVTGAREEIHPIPPEQLRVFRLDTDIPSDARNGRIDEEFVPMAKVGLPRTGEYPSWKANLVTGLRRLAFHHFPLRIPEATRLASGTGAISRVATEPGIQVRLRAHQLMSARPERVVLFVAATNIDQPSPDWLTQVVKPQDALYLCEPRGVGASRWTQKNPPNYVERAHYLLGRTVDSGRVWDIAATGRYLHSLHPEVPVYLAGEGSAAALAAYAALVEPEIDGLILRQLPDSHMSDDAPALMNVLRVCDIPEAVGMAAPRPVALIQASPECEGRIRSIYEAAGAGDRLSTQ